MKKLTYFNFTAKNTALTTTFMIIFLSYWNLVLPVYVNAYILFSLHQFSYPYLHIGRPKRFSMIFKCFIL